MAEENAKKLEPNKVYEVKAANGGSYIDGLPMLKWGGWRDNTYCGSIAVVTEALREPVGYETLMGVSGLCYRFAMKSDWCPSSALAQNSTVYDADICAAIGREMYGIADAAKRDQHVKESLDAGRPVICLGQSAPPNGASSQVIPEKTARFSEEVILISRIRSRTVPIIRRRISFIPGTGTGRPRGIPASIRSCF